MFLGMRGALAAMLTAAAFLAAPAGAQDLQDVEKACHAGENVKSLTPEKAGGSMPLTIDGVMTVSPREAKCLAEKLGNRLAVVQAMTDESRLLHAVEIPELGVNNPTRAQMNVAVAKILELGLGEDHAKPILVYCHHSSCPLSPVAATRLVKLGSEHIYWMRDGIDGWRKAGYQFAKDMLDAKGLSPEFYQAAAKCDDDLGLTDVYYVRAVFYHSQDVDRGFDEFRQQTQQSRAECLRGLKDKYRANAAAEGDVTQRLAQNDAEVRKAYASGRAKVEVNPKEAFTHALDAIDPDALVRTLALARKVKPLAQICGGLDFNLPAATADASELQAARDRYNKYTACATEVQKAAKDEDVDSILFEDAVTVAAATRKYTCSVGSQPNCIPDASWKRAADVATPSNLAEVQKAHAVAAGRKRELGRAAEMASVFQAGLDDRIQEHNAWVEKENARRSASSSSSSYNPPTYTAPAYTPPPPVYRPITNGIYQGVK